MAVKKLVSLRLTKNSEECVECLAHRGYSMPEIINAAVEKFYRTNAKVQDSDILEWRKFKEKSDAADRASGKIEPEE